MDHDKPIECHCARYHEAASKFFVQIFFRLVIQQTGLRRSGWCVVCRLGIHRPDDPELRFKPRLALVLQMIRPWVAKGHKFGFQRPLAFGVGHFPLPVYWRVLREKLGNEVVKTEHSRTNPFVRGRPLFHRNWSLFHRNSWLATTGKLSIALMPGRLRHRTSDASTASVNFGQRCNSDFSAQRPSIRAS
jgi:hypothetical protein